MPAAGPPRIGRARRAFHCRCGRPVFFRNSVCLGCGTALGYDPQRLALFPLVPATRPGVFAPATAGASSRRYRRCANLDSPAGCNWLVPLARATPDVAPIESPIDAATGAPTEALTDAPPPLCACCRLTRTLPDLAVAEHGLWWQRIEQAKRRLVSQLLGLGLRLPSRAEDPAGGLAFDLLRAPPGGPPVITGHADGVITLDVEEADDARREQRRTALHEPYRTLLGHLRHESGHYFWQRLVEPGPWLAPFRDTFGDERADYGAALQRHHAEGPASDWPQRCVSAYASAHPWEDFAETWAHYLHLVDTLDTAASFRLSAEALEPQIEPFDPALLADATPAEGAAAVDPAAFLALLNGWVALTGVLNELARSMGQADFYPFVLPAPAVRKLWFVHRLIVAQSIGQPRLPGGRGPRS